MISIQKIKPIQDNKFDISLFINGVGQTQRVSLKQVTLFDDQQTSMLIVKDIVFSSFCRNNPKFVTRLVKILQSGISKNAFPVRVQLEWTAT